MRAGTLRHRLQFQRGTPTQDEFGEEVLAWSTYATVWGRVSPMAGAERWAAQQINAELTHEIEVRWSTDVSAVQAKDRILFDGRTFDVAGPYVPDERNINIVIPCAEEID